jgi:O-antigen/teichoic acid export membrane protein
MASLATSQAITWTLTIAWTLIVPRALGPDQMGVLVIATSVTSIVAVVLAVPPKQYLVREMVLDPAMAPRLLNTSLLARVATLPMIFGVSFVYGNVAGLDSEAMTVLYLMGVATLVTMLIEPALCAFQATERMQYMAYSDVANKSMQTLGAIVLALAGFGVVALAGYQVVVGLVALLLALLWVHRLTGMRAKPVRLAPVLRRGAPYWMVSLGFIAYLWADGVILGILVPTEVVGWYGAATRLFTTMMFIAVIVTTAVLPRLIAAHSDGQARMASVARAPLEWLVILGVAMAVGVGNLADEVVPLLFGPEYVGAVAPLTVLAAILPLMYANMMVSQLFVASGRPMVIAGLLGFTALVNIGLNFVLIPWTQYTWGNGAVGAAVALLVAEALQLVVAMLVGGRGLITPSVVSRVARAVVPSAAMAGVLWWMDGSFFAAQIVVGGLVYLALSALLKVPTDEERRMAVSYLRRPWSRGNSEAATTDVQDDPDMRIPMGASQTRHQEDR